MDTFNSARMRRLDVFGQMLALGYIRLGASRKRLAWA